MNTKKSEPITVYHATTKDFFDFVPSSNGDFGSGIYLTDSLDGAQMYANTRKRQEPSTIKTIYIDNQGGIDKDFLIKSLGIEAAYGAINEIIYHINENGKQTKEQLTALCHASHYWSLSHISPEHASKIVNYFANKEVHLKEQPNPQKRARILKVELSGLIISADKTLKETGLPQMSLETLCTLYKIEYPIKNKQQFIKDVLDKSSTFYVKNKDAQEACHTLHKQLHTLLTEYSKQENNLSATLTKQAAMSPRLDKGTKLAETLLRMSTENLDISYLVNKFPNFCNLMKIDGLKIYDDTFNLTYYLVKNPKACHITEYMDEKTDGKWKPAPKRPLSQEENLYHHFGMKKTTNR